MQPYIIRQGDYLAKLAYKFSFDAEAVWNDPKNAELQKLRPNPNILLAGDILYIPDPAPVQAGTKSLTSGTTNSFASNCPTVPVTICFLDASLASHPYTVNELPQLTGLTTGTDGTASFEVPVTMQAVTLVFTSGGTTFNCQTGNLDPINTLSGICQRLQHLGYLSSTLDPTSVDPDSVRAGLLALKAAQPGDSAPPSSTPSSSPPSSPDSLLPASASSIASAAASGPTSSPASLPPTSSPPPCTSPGSVPQTSPESAPASSAPPSSGGVDSAPPSSREPTGDPPDDSGLNDDGTLDDATAALLVHAHGV